MKQIILFVIILCVLSCGSDPIPKPKALLRLDYPAPEYASIDLPIPFTFEKNTLATDISEIKIAHDGQSIGIDLNYPLIKGTVFITYKEVKNNINLLLLDAQELTQKHTQKADEITSTPYVDSNNRVFGMFYEVGGNAASQSQFYVTDSLNHFVTGSLYFYAKPNYDSILPAAHYLKNDIRHIMETIKWKQ